MLPLLVPAAVAALAASSRRANAAPASGAAPRARKGAMPWSQYLALVTPYANAFKVPTLLLAVVSTIESGRNPNVAPNMKARGGAWGMNQIKLSTAQDLFNRFGDKLRKFPEAAAWDGTGPGLAEPHLNALLSAFYLAGIWKMFPDFQTAAAAYNRGPTAVKTVLEAGGQIPDDLTAPGKAYVAAANKARAEVESQTREYA